jgi:CubicO group peptidase (beta-lactamase class C family)
VSGAPRLQALLDEGVAAGVFPCAAAVVLHRGRRIFDGAAGGATARTVFDLASLTKVMATTTAFLALWREGLVAPEMPVARVLPGSAAGRAGAQVGDLLAHRAGLPAYRPFFAKILREMPALREPGCPPAVRAAGRVQVVASALAVGPEAPRGARAVYSDVGFIVLGELLAQVAGCDLEALVLERVMRPLGLATRFHRLSFWRAPSSSDASSRAPSGGLAIAPTGRTRPREPAPGQEGLWEPFVPASSLPGEVDDDNAWAMDGVAGHSGLFGTAGDVAAFGQAVLEDVTGAGRVAPARYWTEALQRDTATAGSTRALGFDTRIPGDPESDGSAGALMGTVPPGAAGHTGFTGTSLWIDLGRSVVVALCTNRTAGPRGRAEGRIRDFRPRFHDTAIEISTGASP